MKNFFSLKDRLKSIRYALNGVKIILESQHNAWIHAGSTLAVIICGFVFSVSLHEWCWLILAVCSVWTAEALNTALEFLCDLTSPDFHPLVMKSKDVAAGAVFITAMGALLVGCIIFVPKIWQFLKAIQI